MYEFSWELECSSRVMLCSSLPQTLVKFKLSTNSNKLSVRPNALQLASVDSFFSTASMSLLIVTEVTKLC